MNKVLELIKIADIHADRIFFAIDKLRSIFPISAENVQKFSEQELLLIELLTSRFAKLQDFIGAKCIDAFLDSKAEMIAQMTMIDKINKLELLGVIETADLWFKMREVRNHLSHEYPDNYEIIAEFLNQVFVLAPKLLELLHNIKKKIK
jgi:hypothetical protein